VSQKRDAGDFSFALVEDVASTEGEERLEDYLVEVVAEVFELCPAVRQRISDLLLADLKEEVARQEDPRFSRSTIALIETIEDE
jgi:hypothetical protein